MALIKEISQELVEFQWGKAGGRGKTSQFYKSFTLDGIDYALHDCVFLWKDCETQLYVGKLVKIWETNTKLKKVKVQWFFHPSEISYHLKDEKVLKNEVLFASGEGAGVANINPLEAIVGKCNVVCISEDSRNRKPSNEELRNADYFFYRTFDVDNYNISDKWGDHAGELEVKFIFNRMNDISNNSGIPHGGVDDRDAIGCKVNHNLLTMGLFEDPKSKSTDKFASCDNMVSFVEKAMKRPERLDNRVAKRMKLEMGDHESKEIKTISSKERTKVAFEDCLVPRKDLQLDSMVSYVDVSSQKREGDQVFGIGKINLPLKFVDNSRSIASSKSSINLKPVGIDKSKKIVVTRRPIAEKNTWFKDLAWEDRMLTAQEQGTIILLQNLDSEYTSGEVEDIIWHVFEEKCFAKMVQHTALSSPACGQALVILKSTEVVNRVLKELRDNCLMLPNGRPLVGGPARFPKVSEKQANFVGHLLIEKIKHKMQKDTKEAVSTSHHSQANTVEYEMAKEWFLLQARSTMWWKKLYKKQADEIENLKAKLKSK